MSIYLLMVAGPCFKGNFVAVLDKKVDSFGPARHNAWALEPDGLSLVRKALTPKPLRFDAKPQSIEIDIARSAVVVVDMQNDFCHPDGWFAQKGISVKPMRKPIPTIKRLLPAWRQAGGAVVWLNWGVRPDCLNLSPTIQFKGKGGSHSAVGYADRSPNDRGQSVVPGEWGAQVIHEFKVEPTDITILLFVGVNTDRCIFSSLQDAAFIGYDCVLLAEACGTPSPAYVTRAIHYIVQLLHGFVGDTNSLLAALTVGSHK